MFRLKKQKEELLLLWDFCSGKYGVLYGLQFICLAIEVSATKCSDCSAVLLYRHKFLLIFLRKRNKNTRKSVLEWVKDATSSNCVQVRVVRKTTQGEQKQFSKN